MNDDIPTTESTPEAKERRPIAEAVWFVLFFIGCVTLILAGGGMMWCVAGSQLHAMLSIFMPIFIGIPATLLFVVQTFICRLNRLHISLMLLLAHVLVFALNFVVGVIASC